MFEFLVIAAGTQTVPVVPTFPGQEIFHPQIMHRRSIGPETEFKDKKVVIVGADQSIQELACSVVSGGA